MHHLPKKPNLKVMVGKENGKFRGGGGDHNTKLEKLAK